MLEATSLILTPWQRNLADAASVWMRAISDGATGRALGSARYEGAGRGGIWSWFSRRAIAALETEDASLVFTLRRGFWRVWEVFDAEEHHVGTICRNAISLTGLGRLATLFKPRNQRPGRCLSSQGVPLAQFFSHGQGGWEVCFAGELTNPFARMMLLATVLAWPPEPG